MKTSRRFVASSSSQPALLHPVTPPSAAQFPPPFVRCPRTAAARHSQHCRLQLQDCGLLLMLLNSTCCWLWWCCAHEPCDDTRRVHCPPRRLRDNNINTDSGTPATRSGERYYQNIITTYIMFSPCLQPACTMHANCRYSAAWSRKQVLMKKLNMINV